MRRVTSIATPVAHLVGPGQLKVVNGHLAYTALDETARWDAQAHFWEAIAEQCKSSPAVFCYDLMNEPVVPGGSGKQEQWLAGELGGKHFVQFITRERRDRDRSEIARQWIDRLVTAIRRRDRR